MPGYVPSLAPVDHDGDEAADLLPKYPCVGRVLLSRRLALALADGAGWRLPWLPPFPNSVLPGLGEGNGPSASTPVNCVCGCRIWRRAGVVIVLGLVVVVVVGN